MSQDNKRPVLHLLKRPKVQSARTLDLATSRYQGLVSRGKQINNKNNNGQFIWGWGARSASGKRSEGSGTY